MRVDTGTTSVITDPRARQVTVLDHLTKEARILPMTPTPPQLPQLGMPQMGAAAPSIPPPPMAPMQVQDLGKSVINGHPVDGKRYIIQPPPPPQLPQMPQMPQAPQMPGMPAMPQAPKPPAPPMPQMPTTVDVWSSTKLGMPVMTQVTGPFGQQTCICKTGPTAEPHPGLFQIPPGYKPVMPQPPALPK